MYRHSEASVQSSVHAFEDSLNEFAYENDEWGRSQVDAEDPYFLQEQMQLIGKSKEELILSREKDSKFTPLRHHINFFSVLLVLIGIGHIISSGKHSIDMLFLTFDYQQ